VSVDYGAMTETVIEGVSGYRCHTLQDWLDGIEKAGDLDRRVIADIARGKWSLESCGQRYDKIFQQLNDLYRAGWYELREISFVQIEQEEGPFAKRLAKWITDFIGPQTVLDVGCGPGIYVDALREQGVTAFGIDTDKRIVARDYLKQQSLFECTDTAELVMCLEVAEHIPEDQADAIVRSITAMVELGGLLIWSAAQPGQGGTSHINCQPKQYWLDLLTAYGLVQETEIETQLLEEISKGYHMGWFLQNAMVFRNPKWI
jgi:2-polyprenyl-3-methyl-5-hydroxy-6-metoxy-1,4-benzoquinol methylase